jgi:hypothetical protein
MADHVVNGVIASAARRSLLTGEHRSQSPPANPQPTSETVRPWRRLKVTFPERIATHSAQQTFYFDRQGLLKRHDYDVDIAGRTPAAHYVSAATNVSGIIVPTKHRIFPRQPDGSSAPAPLVVSIDISDVEFS